MKTCITEILEDNKGWCGKNQKSICGRKKGSPILLKDFQLQLLGTKVGGTPFTIFSNKT